MTNVRRSLRHGAKLFVVLYFLAASGWVFAQMAVTTDPPFYGPYNGVFLADGDGLRKRLVEHDSVLRADSPWSIHCWISSSGAATQFSLVAGLGELTEEYPRYLALDRGKLVLWMGGDNLLEAKAELGDSKWHFIAATFDGTDFRLYSDGIEVGAGKLTLGSVSNLLQMAPSMPVQPTRPSPGSSPGPWVIWPPAVQHFGGKIASLTLTRQAIGPSDIKLRHQAREDFSVLEFEEGSKPWPVQTRGQAGYRAPQDPATMPKSRAAYTKPVPRTLPPSQASLQPEGDKQWTLANNWTLTPAAKVNAEGAEIARLGFSSRDWLPATVPGTVLTTMIDRGIYPDPDYGLNNLQIPESLNQQDYWYRNEFPAPSSLNGKRLTLVFGGINYRSRVWLNGTLLGTITGAFIRGVFDVSAILKPGAINVLALRVSPPPHPGIPQEQSMRGGPGENGGIMCLDGPTFVATEGWDWIPAIRDRNTGIWQPVTLLASGTIKIGDPQVVTTLPLADNRRAQVEIAVPLENASSGAVEASLNASFEGVKVTKRVTVSPGKSEVKLSASEFSQLTVENPRLWWPNGYGKPELYHLVLSIAAGGKESDSKRLRFGIRQISYELSLLDRTGHLRRVEYSPAEARNKGERVIDITHNGMREIPGADPFPPNFAPEQRERWKSWVASLVPGGETSSAIRALEDTRTAPYLVIRVNGVRIACRGGNWGMDDSRKRVSRERLEPFFRLHRDANLNIIRNWVGQDTEEVFYDLADEYGQLIWNDFWETTQNYNIEAEDPALFLENAKDTILRFRNHPSIAVWCGRNEGVPQPIINQGLDDLIVSLDGTRYYSPSSNEVNLQNSGPYRYMPPELYFTTLNHGFAVETGTPSMPTLESFRASIPTEDQWPISDDWAYHDWHQSGNGDVAPLLAEIQAEFGAPISLEDFERKAQMLNYVDHRAIFEGMNAHLWAPNSGRLLWMTQPAWPSTMWQILSHDYDTQASFYGVKKACEPVHVQLDLSNYEVSIVNTTINPIPDLIVTASVVSLDNKPLLRHQERRDAAADQLTPAFPLELAPLLGTGVVLVRLELRTRSGELLSDNFYWLAASSPSYRQLNRLPAATVSAAATWRTVDGRGQIHVQLKDTGSVAVLAGKLTLLNQSDGARILPAYISDNYVSLLPGETRAIEIEYPSSSQDLKPQLTLRGWNLSSIVIPLTADR